MKLERQLPNINQLWTVSFSEHDDRELTVSEIALALRDGIITRDTLVWHEGMPEWKRILESRDLVRALGRRLIEVNRGARERAKAREAASVDGSGANPRKGTEEFNSSTSVEESIPTIEHSRATLDALPQGFERPIRVELKSPHHKAPEPTATRAPALAPKSALPSPSPEQRDRPAEAVRPNSLPGRASKRPGPVVITVASRPQPTTDSDVKGTSEVQGARPLVPTRATPPDAREERPPAPSPASTPEPSQAPLSSLLSAGASARSATAPQPKASAVSRVPLVSLAPRAATSTASSKTRGKASSEAGKSEAGKSEAGKVATWLAAVALLTGGVIWYAGTSNSPNTTTRQQLARPAALQPTPQAPATESSRPTLVAEPAAEPPAEPAREEPSPQTATRAARPTPTAVQRAAQQAVPRTAAPLRAVPSASPESTPSDTPALVAFDSGLAATALAEAAVQSSSCRAPGDPSGIAKLAITFSPSGKVTQAQLHGPPFAGTQTGSCIANRMRGITVPAFAGDRVTVTKTVVIQ